MPADDDPVFALLRASLDPACQTAAVRSEHPVCRVVAATARKDVAAGGMENISFLAAGVAFAGAAVTGLFAEHHDLEPAKLMRDLLVKATEDRRKGHGKDVPWQDEVPAILGLTGFRPCRGVTSPSARTSPTTPGCVPSGTP